MYHTDYWGDHSWGMMNGGWGITYGILGTITWLMFIAVLGLAIVWLWRQINKK